MSVLTKLAAAAAVVFLLPVILVVIVAGGVASVFSSTGSGDGVCAPVGASATSAAGYGPEQMGNAATIVAVGKQMQVPEYGWVIAVATAMQESGLRNLPYGDRDSLGLFQQRPSQGWGTPEQILTPAYAATQFYQHLLTVPNWQQMTLAEAAQTVQRSGFPDRYASHEQGAREIVGALTGVSCGNTAGAGTGDCNTIQAPTPAAMTAINWACGQRGLPYVWGGKCAELLLMQHWAGPAHAKNWQVEARPVVGSSVHFALSTWEYQVRLDKTQRCCVRCNAMGRAVDLPGAAHLVLASDVVHLDPASAVFEAMLVGWATQQRARFLKVVTTVKPRSDLVRRFASYTNQYPWQWEPAEAEAFIVSLSIAPSTARNYQNCLRMFCEFITDARYGWPTKCLELFGSAPQQILHEANTISHVTDYEGDPARRPLTYDEVQALFDAADGRVEEIQSRHRKGALTAMRDSAMLKTVYAFGLRRQETVGLDVADWRRNPKVPAYGRFGGVFVRWGKSSNGSPPKRRTVFTVAELDWIVPALEHYLTEVRPQLAAAQHPAMWVTERGGRLSRRRLNRTFSLVRDLAGLPPELDLHALRHSFVTHLVEFDYPQKFVQDQCGHSWGSTTAIYTGVSDEYRNRLVQRALTGRHAADLWEDQP